jgi:predicted AlkP superfamily phosphohydrolase/phosphomutase
MKLNDPKNQQMDFSVCQVDPMSKPTDCPWDKVGHVVESFNREDQIGLKFMAKMFGGKNNPLFEDTMTNQEWLATLTAEEFYDAFMKELGRLNWIKNSRLAFIKWLDEKHVDCEEE